MPDQKYTAATATLLPAKRKKVHARYAGVLLTTIGFIANVTAIAGLIRSNADILVITAAVLATLCGLYLLLRRWGKPVGWYTMLAVAVIVSGSVMLTVALKTRDTNTDMTDPGGGSSGQDTNGGNVKSDGKPINKTSHHTVVFEKQFELGTRQGLELDDEKGTLRYQQTSAKSPIDLYLSESPYLAITIGKFSPYIAGQLTGNADNDEYTACKNLVAANDTGSTVMGPSSVKPGQQYCITTTLGRIALLTMQEMIDAGYNSPNHKATFTIKLWN